MDSINTPRNRFADNLYAIMEKRNLKRERMAEDLEVETRTIYYWLCGQRHPNYDGLIKLSNYLSVSVDDLLR